MGIQRKELGFQDLRIIKKRYEQQLASVRVERSVAGVVNGLKVNRVLVHSLRDADDTVLITNSLEELHRLLDLITSECDSSGLNICKYK